MDTDETTVIEQAPGDSLAHDVARRSLADREQVAVREIRRLIDAGIEVLATSSTARVADIVSASGLSNSAFYRYFSSKDELIAAILTDGSERLASYLDHQMAKHDEPRAQVTRWVTGVLDQARDPAVAEPTRALLVQGRGSSGSRSIGAPDAVRLTLVAPLTAMGRPEPERDSVLVADGVVGLLQRHLRAGTSPTDAEVDHAVGFVLAALDDQGGHS